VADGLTKDLKRRMDGAIEALRKEFAGIRTGRASAGLLDPVMVDAYGSMLMVQVWDKALLKPVEKAIRDANLGLNPQADGASIRVPIPDLNEERRRELVKVAAKYTEQAKVSVRNVRRDGIDALKKLEKDGEISQDEQRKVQADIQALTDDTIKKVDDAFSQKEKEISQV